MVVFFITLCYYTIMSNITIKVLLTLLSKNKVTASTLATDFCVSKKTIYRCIDSLSISGVPVYTKQGKSGGIVLDESFDIRKFILSKH